jgi:SNF2 family DNA or RNA helicase
LSKTLAAIATAGVLYQQGRIRKVLVTAPTSVCSVWPKELDEYADFPFRAATLLGDKKHRLQALAELNAWPFKGLKVAVINYESTWRDEIAEALLQWKPNLVIADESQRIKTHNAAQSKALHRLGDQAQYKLILSGTPIQNNAVDLYSQYRFLDPSVFGANFYAFRSRYCIMGGFDKHQIVGYRDMDELIQKEHSIAYRVTKAEALDLPEQTFENRYIQFEPADRRVYDQLKKASFAELDNGGKITATTVLTKLLRLRQLTGGFLRADETVKPEHVNSAKLDALMEIIEDYVLEGGEKLVIFAQFTAEIDLICNTLKAKGIQFGCIDGRTPMETRRDPDTNKAKVNPITGEPELGRGDIVNDFQTNPKTKVFLAQIATAGLGITLHAASVAVFYSLDFNYASYTQATARIHRIGQHHPCTYIHLLVENTVDEKVLMAIHKKDDMAKTVVDNWREYFN